jgi:hypothetical protein
MSSKDNLQNAAFKPNKKLFNFSFFGNPWKFWWKNREFFSMPNIRINFYRQSMNWNARILDFECDDLGWKTKYSEFRQENNPYITLSLFNKFTIHIELVKYGIDELGYKKDCSLEYWEYMLNYAYHNECKYDLLKALHYTGAWSRHSKIWKDTKYYIQYQVYALNKKGRKMLLKHL